MFCVWFMCKCALYYCHRVSTQLHLSNIYHIMYHILSAVFKLIGGIVSLNTCARLRMKSHSGIAIRLWSCVILCFKGSRLTFRICSRCFVFLVHISEDSVHRRRDAERCAVGPHVSRQGRILKGLVGPDLSTQEDEDNALPLKRRDLTARCAASYLRSTQ
jgi:hypothetical protein